MQRVSCVCSKCLTCAKCKMQNAVLLFSPRIFARRRTALCWLSYRVFGFLALATDRQTKGCKTAGGWEESSEQNAPTTDAATSTINATHKTTKATNKYRYLVYLSLLNHYNIFRIAACWEYILHTTKPHRTPNFDCETLKTSTCCKLCWIQNLS